MVSFSEMRMVLQGWAGVVGGCGGWAFGWGWLFLVNGQNGGGIGKDAFREEEADGEVCVLAGGAHGHGDILPATGVGGAVFEADLQWFFDGDGVFDLKGSLFRHDLLHGQAGDAGL